ncbi:hypothetical protein JOB18_036451 [Solea senegalensis]|uniref:Uncharacterized protein n=1 Tax=Solea senegalensis TaxID=28829 RepID=A0AAV6RMU3_SOLSE|nr:hypothetical protein JOB18_036451 [Solea senegalensis]
MSSSPHIHVPVDEGILLKTSPGSGIPDDHKTSKRSSHSSSWKNKAASFCEDKHHRKLAKWSIICGISCIGIKALIYSVKAEEAMDPEMAADFSQRAKKYGIISIRRTNAASSLTLDVSGSRVDRKKLLITDFDVKKLVVT